MSTFVESQTLRLCEAVDKYAQRLGFIEGPSKDFDGVTIPGESVPVEMTIHPSGRKARFSANGLCVTVKITDNPDGDPLAGLLIFPCGSNLSGLVQKTAKAVVHALFDPA